MGSVMNFTSGVEAIGHWKQALRGDIRNVLAAYFQFWESDTSFVANRKKAHPQMRFMIDSGAHTFRTDIQKFQSWKMIDYEKYVDKYAAWLWDNRKYIFAGVELDIAYTLNVNLTGNYHSQLGQSVVDNWRNNLFMPLVKKGLEIIFVWHDEDGWDAWETMCAKYAYLGLPGAMGKEDRFRQFVAVAKKYSTKIHGFAATKQADFRDRPWYSIDSITWKGGEMYGEMMDWNPVKQKLLFLRSKDLRTGENERRPLRWKFEKYGFDADAIINPRPGTDDYKEVTRYSLWSMRQMELFYADRYKDRLQYFELRLPAPARVQNFTDKAVMKWFERFQPNKLFKHHVNVPIHQKKQLLVDLATIQSGDVAACGQPGFMSRMAVYFPALFQTAPTDGRVLQKELAAYAAPPVPPPLERDAVEHFMENDQAPKAREERLYSEDDLVYRPETFPLYGDF